MVELSAGDVRRITTRYIGVSGGYLGDFSYRTHADFYPEYCDVDYDPNEIEGTTRERFIHILSKAPPGDQAKIIRGVVERFPVDGSGPRSRTVDRQAKLLELARRLEGVPSVEQPSLKSKSEAVESALSDAATLIDGPGAHRAVDRVFTALHGYLLAVAESEGIELEPDAPLTGVFKTLRSEHPNLQANGARAADITKIIRALASILDALQPVRNRASGAHPNTALLEPAEAMLIVNVVRSLLHYLDQKL